MKSDTSKKSTNYVAFLRGINVGGNHLVKMADLTKLLESLGYTSVKTLLASGNVSFGAPKKEATEVKAHLEKELAKKFGFNIPVVVRTTKELEELAAKDPFKGIEVTPDTRLYITFLPEKPAKDLRTPYVSEAGDFSILKVTDGEVCSVLDLSKKMGTVDAMAILEKKFGKGVTTRNWNTVQKLLAAASK